jgi:hypothetical protein
MMGTMIYLFDANLVLAECLPAKLIRRRAMVFRQSFGTDTTMQSLEGREL